VVPQVRIEKRIFDLQNHSQKLSDTFLKVQAKIDEYKAKGKDVTVWQKTLDDSKMLVANDMNTLANALTKAAALKPSDYGTTSKATIESINNDIKNVVKDFNSIKKNLHKPNTMGDVSRKVKGDGVGSNSPLFGTSWIWTTSTVAGVSTAAPVGGKFVLSFGEDNRVNSTTDCNGVGGSYSLGANNTLSFGQFMSTMMFCEGSRESEYSSQLMKTASYAIDGTTLRLTNASGTMVFTKK
jgi:heat shock protein HslJ